MKPISKRPRGRPTRYAEQIAEEICDRLSNGEPLQAICRDAGMPAARTVSDWKAKDPTFSANIARAREEGFDALAAECLQIADNIDEDAQSRRVRIEARLKLLAKWDYKRYGDKIAHDVTAETRFIPLNELTEKVRQIELRESRLVSVGSQPS